MSKISMITSRTKTIFFKKTSNNIKKNSPEYSLQKIIDQKRDFLLKVKSSSIENFIQGKKINFIISISS